MISLPEIFWNDSVLQQDECRCNCHATKYALWEVRLGQLESGPCRWLPYCTVISIGVVVWLNKPDHPGDRRTMHRRDFIAGCVGLSLTVKAGAALGQSGPLTRIIFPFAAGGGGDALCRVVAQHLGQPLDRNVIVENRTGGDGLIGIKSVKGAAP